MSLKETATCSNPKLTPPRARHPRVSHHQILNKHWGVKWHIISILVCVCVCVWLRFHRRTSGFGDTRNQHRRSLIRRDQTSQRNAKKGKGAHPAVLVHSMFVYGTTRHSFGWWLSVSSLFLELCPLAMAARDLLNPHHVLLALPINFI